MKYLEVINKIPNYEHIGDECKIFAKDYLDYILKYEFSGKDSNNLMLNEIVDCLNEKINEEVKVSGPYLSRSRPLSTIKVQIESKKKARQMLELLNEYC